MPRHIFLVFVIFCMTTPALAESKESRPRLKANENPIEKFTGLMRAHLSFCGMEVYLATVRGPYDISCIEKRKEEMKPLFEAAKKSAAKNPKLQSLIKDTYAHWLASMSALPSGLNEPKILYRARVKARQDGFDDLAQRLELEQ